MSDTVQLQAVPQIKVLGQSSVAVSGAADTNENVLATVTVPAGSMGLNGRLRVTALLTLTNSANNKTVRVRLGGIGGSIFTSPVMTTSASTRFQIEIANRGAANSQVGGQQLGTGGWGISGNVVATAAIDTSADTTVVITGQKASAGETITLESYLVELIP